MSTKRKEIDLKYMPTRFPFWQTLIAYLFVDYHNAPGWVWGSMGAFVVLLWIAAAIAIWNCDRVKPSEI